MFLIQNGIGNNTQDSKGIPVQFKGHLKFIIFLNLTFFAFIMICFFYLFSKSDQKFFYSGLLLFFLIVIMSTVLIVLILYFFIKKVYDPIIEIERALMSLEKAEIDFKLTNEKQKNSSQAVKSINHMFQLLKESMDREYTTKILKKQAELAALQSQINPHFLYNTLDSIRGKATSKGVYEIADMTEALSSFFRYSISQKGSIVTLQEELENVENYLIIQQFRFNKKFQIVYLLDEFDKDIMKYKLPNLTIQPLVENAIYHGLEPKLGPGKVIIQAYTTETRFIITIIDDGLGIEPDKLDQLNETLSKEFFSNKEEEYENVNGLALININQRIKLYFGNEYGINISSTQNIRTEVELILPLMKDF